METNHLRCWAETDLDALENNMRLIRSKTNENAMVMAVVKADAYGHGAVMTAKTVLTCGADALGVATVSEAMELREAGITAPILILGAIPAEDMPDAIKYDVITTAFNYENARQLSETATNLGKKAKIHIKIDTGMHRIGINVKNPGFAREVKAIKNLPGIEAEGIFSHLACADTDDEAFTLKQIELFEQALETLEKEGITFKCRHLANSAGIFRYPQAHYDMVRAGIVCYGCRPSEEIHIPGLMPVMSFRCNVSCVKTIGKGDCVSYGATFTAEKDTDIATLTVGYADGYSRILSDRTEILLHGKRAKIVGRICMDQCMADVSGVNNIAVGDVATLFGKDRDSFISADEIAQNLGTINYEVLCMVSRRVPRLYIKDGKCVSRVNYII